MYAEISNDLPTWITDDPTRYPPRLIERIRSMKAARAPLSHEEAERLEKKAKDLRTTPNDLEYIQISKAARNLQEEEDAKLAEIEKQRQREEFAAQEGVRQREQEEQQRLKEIEENERLIEKEDGILGPRYRGCTFDSWVFYDVPRSGPERQLALKIRGHQEAAVGAVKEYAENIRDNVRGGRNLILFGPVGTGKDHLMSAVAKAVSRSLNPVRYPNCLWDHPERLAVCIGANFFSRLRDAMGAGGESEEKITSALIKSFVLLLSDPTLPGGAELTPYQRGQLFRIINDRSNAMRPTICTINAANERDIMNKLSPQIADRLLNGATVVECNWPSYRKPQKVIYSSRQE